MAPAANEATAKRMLLSPIALAAPLVLVIVPHAAGVKVKVVLANAKPVGNVSSA